jgi:hypothetical protein
MYSTLEQQSVVENLRKSHEGLISAVSGLSEAQLNFKPEPDAWSIANIVEHLAIIEDLVAWRLSQLGSAPDVSQQATFKGSDRVLLEKVLDRSTKIKAPDRAQPTGKPLTHSLERLTASRDRIVEFVQSAPADFRRHIMLHPVFGGLDGHQWLLALAGHCERHTQQVEDTKSAESFPRT